MSSKVKDTHVVKPVFAELSEQVQEADQREPGAPQQHLVHVLHVEDAEHEDELVEHVVPELVFHPLGFGHPELAEDQPLDEEAEQRQRTIRHIDKCL